jgi:uncharacterized protein YjbJ (UPF0337 family)
MSLEDKAKVTAKKIEGKAQEAFGNVTGDPEDQAKGKAKQAESQVRHVLKTLKTKLKKPLTSHFV